LKKQAGWTRICPVAWQDGAHKNKGRSTQVVAKKMDEENNNNCMRK